MSDYFDGAVMAYRDSQELIDGIIDNMPPELEYLKPQFRVFSTAIGEKANTVIDEVNKRKKTNG